MDTLLHRFSTIIKGRIEGFDRLIFKGTLKTIAYALGMQSFLATRKVLNKDYKEWVTNQSTCQTFKSTFALDHDRNI